MAAEPLILTADCVEALAAMDEASVDAVVTDPPYGLEFMGKEWDRLGATLEIAAEGADVSHPFRDGSQRVRYGATAAQMQDWHQAWATQALRVLKPGGHLLAFGGTRTYHRLACAVEDAGFEIRDSLIWLYGSGFPKSHSVSQGIEKRLTTGRDRNAQRDLGLSGAEPWKEGRPSGQLHAATNDPVPLTTPEAQRWQGWGTALKPSHEIVVCAQKPDAGDDAKLRVNLWLLAEQLSSLASAAASDSESKPAEHVEAMFASVGWTADERRNTRAALCEAMGTSQFESALTSSSSIVSSWRATLDALCELTSTFTTETASSTTTALRTLKSSLSDLTPRSIIQAAMNPDGSTLSALPAVRAFAAVESRLSATRELLAPAPATSESPDDSPVAADRPPSHEPIVVARKPLAGTVAANVLEHGTGALNVDATRTPASEPYSDAGRAAYSNGGTSVSRIDDRGSCTLGNPNPGTSAELHARRERPPANGCECGQPWTGLPDSPVGCPACRRFDDEPARLSEAADLEAAQPQGDALGFPSPDGEATDTLANQSTALNDYIGRWPANVVTDEAARDILGVPWFYCAKASRAERNAGLGGFEEREAKHAYGDGLNSATKIRTEEQAAEGVVRDALRNSHPT